jgi:hypothetical protein
MDFRASPGRVDPALPPNAAPGKHLASLECPLKEPAMNIQGNVCRLVLSLLVAAAMLGAFAITPALAQTRAALVKNVDEPGRAPYQHTVDFSPGECTTPSFCIVEFPAVPAGKRLVVENITVYAAVAEGGAPTLLAFGDLFVTNQGNRYVLAPAFTQSMTAFGSTFHALDRAVRVYYEPGEIPKVKIGASASFVIISNMSLHGYLIDAL